MHYRYVTQDDGLALYLAFGAALKVLVGQQLAPPCALLIPEALNGWAAAQGSVIVWAPPGGPLVVQQDARQPARWRVVLTLPGTRLCALRVTPELRSVVAVALAASPTPIRGWSPAG
jgi:hypothetical protein